MEKMVKAYGNGKGRVPPFIFLSDVLHHYGSCDMPPTGGANAETLASTKSDPRHSTFGGMLADRIEKKDILIFDVYTLALIAGLELEEVLHFLRGFGSRNASTIAIDKGRDYYMDGERTIGWISTTNISSSAGKKEASRKTVKSSVAKLYAEVQNGVLEDDWGRERARISDANILLKLAQGRVIAERERAREVSGVAARLSRNVVRPALAVGATAPSTNEFDHSHFYVVGKFNRDGLPALWLDPKDPQSFRGKDKQIRINPKWQSRLDEMHLKDKEKPHSALCLELSKSLVGERGQQSRVVTAATIRKQTRDPGKRRAGGSRPTHSVQELSK